MNNVLMWGIILAVGVVIVSYAWDSSKSEDTIAKKNQQTLNDIRVKIGALQAQLNAHNTRLFDSGKRILEIENLIPIIKTVDAKINRLETEVMLPRRVRVEIPDGVTLKGPVATKKKVTKKAKKITIRKKKKAVGRPKKKRPVGRPPKKIIKKVKRQLKGLSH